MKFKGITEKDTKREQGGREMIRKKNASAFAGGIIFVIILPFIVMFSINVIVDPLWFFNHENGLNKVQEDFDERQQKINRVAFAGEEFDALLIGSSRVTYISQQEFGDENVFNMASGHMSHKEYAPYLEYVEEKRGKPLEKVYIGFDFFATSENKGVTDPDPFIQNAEDRLYPLKAYLSRDMLEQSFKNAEASLKEEPFHRSYDRNNVGTTEKLEPQETQERIEEKDADFEEVTYDENTYTYDETFKEEMQQLQEAHPDTEFIAFTTPVTEELFRTMQQEGREEDYETWLRDITDVFGGVEHFMYVNSITENPDYFYDAHHYYQTLGDLMAHRMAGVEDEELPEDFGIHLTKDNIDEELRTLKQNDWEPEE